MSKSKKLLTSLLAALVMFGQVGAILPAHADELIPPTPLSMYFPTDIENHWANVELSDFVDADILKGYQDAEGTVTIRPNNKITRAEFTTLLVRAAELTTQVQGSQFKDVTAGSWYADAVRITSGLAITKGDGENFYPNRNISRAELAALIVRTFAPTVSFAGEPLEFGDIATSWAKADIAKASSAGIITGYEDGSFKPNATATRAEALTMIYRALQLETSSLPDDQILIDTVLKGEEQSLNAFNNRDFVTYKEASDEYTTGFYRSYKHNDVDMAELLQQEGIKYNVKRVGAFTAEVVDKSDRWAIVELTDAVYEVAVDNNGEVTTETQDESGYWYLRKLADGSWKVYSSDYLYSMEIFMPSDE